MRARIRYAPGLDGLRGISLAAVLLFHHDHDLARGAWGGVSTFFTLSGFLITWLLLVEHEETGTISLRGFYARRARRLLPALGVAIGAVLVFGLLVADSSQLRNLRGDLLGALTYAANWRFALSGESYSDLFANPSPLLHFWTVAIEEQFYILFPPVLLLILRRTQGEPRRTLRAVLLVVSCSVGALVLSGLLGVDQDLIYFGTHTRAAELLLGGALAVAVHAGWTDRAAAHVRRAGPLALLAMVAVWATVAQDSDALYVGGFSAYALLSLVVILAACTPGNLVATLLRVEPLRQLGRISYGAYLYHWPLYQWLTPERTDLEGAPLLGLRLLGTVALALASFHLVELPVRTGRRLSAHRAPAVIAAAVGVLLAGTLVVTADPPPDELAAARERADAWLAQRNAGRPPVPPGAIRIGTYGDSAALITALGLGTWMNGEGHIDAAPTDAGEPGVVGVPGFTEFGCGLLGPSTIRFRDGVEERGDECETWRAEWEATLAWTEPDAVLVQVGQWEVLDRRFPGDDTFRAPGDAVFDERLRAAISDAMDLVLAHDAVVLWLLAPHVDIGTVDGVRPSDPFPESDPARMDRFNALVREVAASKDGRAAVIDLPALLEARAPGGEMDTTLRPDLVHFAGPVFDAQIAPHLGDLVLRTYAELTGWEQPG